MASTPDSAPAEKRAFTTTRWSVVVSAGDASATGNETALATLCELYWYPLYVFVRRRGVNADEAQDLTQGFFTRLIEKRDISSANPHIGRFRTFLLSAFLHYISNERSRNLTAKRGGGVEFVSLDFTEAEQRYLLEPVDDRTPEHAYEKRWVVTLLNRVLADLEREFAEEGKSDSFQRLKPFLTAEGFETPYKQLATEMGVSESALKVAVHRMRRRYRELLKSAVADTVCDPSQVKEEIQFLFNALS